jgi:prepilin-type N-terminal cleavage/methylation domain-containing protein
MRARGFTLIEIAISLVIIALVLGMLVIPLATQFEQQRIAETRSQLEHVREALIGFTVANGRLPCPAIPTTATGAAGAGTENRTGGACVGAGTAVEGVLPWTALGVPETDPWGRRFTYRVTSAFADDPAGTLSSFSLTDLGNLNVTNDGTNNIAASVPAVVVSHGKNGLGAYQPSGTQISGAAAHELENVDGDNTFVSRTHAPDFDDQLAWLSSHVLKSRMVAASRLP